MIRVGEYNELKVLRNTNIGLYLDDGKEGILLPKRFVPAGAKEGDVLKVFIYHDGEDRLIATTQHPTGILGDIVRLPVVSVTPHGAFADWGLMKDIFIPKSGILDRMIPKGEYLVKIVLDERTGRLAATEKFESSLSNENLTVKEKDVVQLTVYRRTDIGYLMIINNRHTGVLHFNEIFRQIREGDKFEGYVKKIYPDTNNIDVVAGKAGYQRVETEADKILRLLKENNGYLPYYDKSDPEEIYAFFAMSKKAFKMAVGTLYKQRLVSLEKTGLKLVE